MMLTQHIQGLTDLFSYLSLSQHPKPQNRATPKTKFHKLVAHWKRASARSDIGFSRYENSPLSGAFPTATAKHWPFIREDSWLVHSHGALTHNPNTHSAVSLFSYLTFNSQNSCVKPNHNEDREWTILLHSNTLDLCFQLWEEETERPREETVD